ncbi:MAG TPA: NAD(P)-dependent alcohol dehydrogenase, partial [Longimicrobium sp.]|nr:NAD(P)-dependent alcohol dehydrogenase [Longimicrobium sp.]
MKAIVHRDYGSPDVLHCEDVEKPAPGDHEVLIKVRAAAANPMDYGFMSGVYLMRLGTGLRRPKSTRPGADVAGEVEAVGKDVTRFQPGDAVFGAARGAFAEYVCGGEDRLAAKPAGLTFEQAAAIPVAGMTALQGLRDKGRVQPGQKVLINGASGGVGTFAVQIARTLGAEVTGVCSGRNVDLVRSLGADHVVDYTRDDFTRGAERYDVMLDCIGNR